MLPAGEEMRIRSLAVLARALGQSEPLLRLLEIAAEEARSAMSAATVSMSRLVSGTHTVRTLVNVGELGPDEVRWPDDETYTIEQFAGLQIAEGLETWAWSLDDDDLPEPERELLQHLGKGSSVGAPIVVDGMLWGEFYATRHHCRPGFDDIDAAYMEALIAILSGAVSRALREESLRQLAYRDPLTGLLNRRALDQQADQMFTLPPGATRTVTAVTIDINGLKLVNDTLGHLAGDQLIQAVAHDLQTAYRPLPGALVARVGGDEFTVLVGGPDPSSTLRISDDLCRRTWTSGPATGVSSSRSTDVPTGLSTSVPTGVSAGAATLTLTPGHHHTPTDLFASADRAQYVAKHGHLTTTVLAGHEDDHRRNDRDGGAPVPADERRQP